MLIGCHHLSSSFIGASMPHWCNTSTMSRISDKSWSLEQMKRFAIPWDDIKNEFDSCHMFDLDALPRISNNFDTALAERKRYSLAKISCERSGVPEEFSWEYDQSEGIKSIVNNVRKKLPLDYEMFLN